MQGARAVLAYRRVPAIAIARDPRVHPRSNPVNTRNKQDPRYEIPTRQQHANVCPSICTTPNVAVRVNGQHPAHSSFSIDLRESRCRGGIMQVERLDAVPCVKTAETRNARAAETARSVVENSEIVHVRSPLYLILRLVCG